MMAPITEARGLANRPALSLADGSAGRLRSRTGNGTVARFRELPRRGSLGIMVAQDQEPADFSRRVPCPMDGEIISEYRPGRDS